MRLFNPNGTGDRLKLIRETAKQIYKTKGSNRFYFYEIDTNTDKNIMKGTIQLMKNNGWLSNRKKDYRGYQSWELSSGALEWLRKQQN